jgi:YidC/Oxa1 family membrane protein insertase
MSEQNKLIFAVVASLGFFYLMDSMYPSKAPAPKAPTAEMTAAAEATIPVTSTAVATDMPRSDALKGDRVQIETPLLRGSLNLKGASIDDIELLAYNETTDPTSNKVVLMSPLGAKDAYTSNIRYVNAANADAGLNDQTLWKLDYGSLKLTPTTPITLVARGSDGVEYRREISIDDKYLFTVKDTIKNVNAKPVSLQAVATITRVGTPVTGGFFVLHEGGVGVLDHKLSEVSYEDIKGKGTIQSTSTGGWIGFTDKYWLSAIIPAKDKTVNATYNYSAGDVYKTQTVSAPIVIEPGKQVENVHHVYTGAKVLRILDGYEVSHGFDRFDLAVDFGWFYFLTKPLFYVLEFLNSLLGNMGFAILLLTVLFKILVFPLANKSHRSMARMKALQPKMDHLKTLYANDKMRMNQELMGLYKKENVNPVAGCLPTLIQAPIFFCLYKVFFVTIEMRHAPFIGWISDLAAPDPASLFTLFGLIPWSPPAFLAIGAWPIIMGATMVLQQRLGPQPSDPQQAKIMMIMPIMFTFMFASFPAGLVIYWAWSNILTIAQQWYITNIEASKVSVIMPNKKGRK